MHSGGGWVAFTGPSYRTRRSGGIKRFGGVTAYGMLRNLFTVAVDDGSTVVVPMTLPGRRTAVGAWLEAAVTEPSSAQRTVELLPNMSIWGGSETKRQPKVGGSLAPRLAAARSGI